ncbi:MULTISPECIES: hypothetical protein [unclassified Sphingobium]|uniref:hypothetical protein n=1 Tax=unclassified Sphingobium TaxID=2611147 RepID=UPI000D16D1A3|nr:MULTISPECIES: hypothetical protein [unclassified Sphingobium]MBG6117709.1 hypothetical protein [Sphingobium sp. JAI105]PSO12779.1 hypothetical protein C7E20_06670 [Sphingobium sp. AEW4]TWD09978.1 YD repeat-containing protein [Sphingobium sp. AEW010]TWD26649.1 YD repeat-containing protein [Sphingobium sp. AEW013]TWD27582.1 YD repeat-containing protein [Sphingobium sp. AEW001]
MGKETKFEYYTDTRLLKKIIAPEGNYAEYIYDPRGNITCTMLVSKTAPAGQTCAFPSTANKIVTEATYPAAQSGQDWHCPSGVGAARCNKPLTKKDPNGQITQYAYDGAHGGITKITLPPPSGSIYCPSAGVVCPETRYTYTSSYYAQFKNGSGTIVNFATPLTRLTNVSSCQTTASCLNSSDETKSVFSYGTSNVLRTTISEGSGDGSLTATTSYTYDNIGNQLTVDGPLAGAADTTRTRYDALRRVIGVVGPDPDGAGSLKHRAQRFTYNGNSQLTVMEIGTVNSQSDPDWANFASYRQLTSTYDAATARKTKDVLTASVPPVAPSTYQVVQYGYDVLGRPECHLWMAPALQA